MLSSTAFLVLMVSADLQAQSFTPTQQSGLRALEQDPLNQDKKKSPTAKPAQPVIPLGRVERKQSAKKAENITPTTRYRTKQVNITDGTPVGFGGKFDGFGKSFETKPYDFGTSENKKRKTSNMANRSFNLPPSFKTNKSNLANRESSLANQSSALADKQLEFGESSLNNRAAPGFNQEFETRPYLGRESWMLENMQRPGDSLISSTADIPEGDLDVKDVKRLLNNYSKPVTAEAVKRALPIDDGLLR